MDKRCRESRTFWQQSLVSQNGWYSSNALKYRNKYLDRHFTSLYKNRNQIQCIRSHGNPRKPLTSLAWWTAHSWIYSRFFLSFFQTTLANFLSGLWKWMQLSSLIIIRLGKSFPSTLYWLRKLHAIPTQFFQCSSISCWGTHHVQTFCISNCSNAGIIVASPALSEKHPAIPRCMSVIVRWWSSSRKAYTHHNSCLREEHVRRA